MDAETVPILKPLPLGGEQRQGAGAPPPEQVIVVKQTGMTSRINMDGNSGLGCLGFLVSSGLVSEDRVTWVLFGFGFFPMPIIGHLLGSFGLCCLGRPKDSCSWYGGLANLIMVFVWIGIAVTFFLLAYFAVQDVSDSVEEYKEERAQAWADYLASLNSTGFDNSSAVSDVQG